MKMHLVPWIVLLLTATRVDALPPTASSLCHAPETTYFSCETGRHRMLSLCGTLPASAQYRYGTASHVELQFPDDASKAADQFGYAHYFRAQVDRSEVSFTRAGTQYAIFDTIEDGKRSAGVQVTTADGRELNVRCAGPVHGELATAGKSLRCDKDSALNLGGCP